MVAVRDKGMQPYTIGGDKKENVWGNLWTSDRIVRFDPAAKKWTAFDLPVRGTEIRHISLMERDGKTQVIVPIYRASQMGVMTLRSEAELASLKSQAKYRRLSWRRPQRLPHGENRAGAAPGRA